MRVESGRRMFLVASGIGGASALLGCRRREPAPPEVTSAVVETQVDASRGGAGEEPRDLRPPGVTVVEDLMRGDALIRRVLVVYREAAVRLRGDGAAAVPLDAIGRAAKLVRTFGEAFHEKRFEEAHVFPAVLADPGNAAAGVVRTLAAQHQRGREITTYVLDVTGSRGGRSHAAQLAEALDAFARMYEAHATVEDTLVLPAWKKTMTTADMEELGDLFEDMEHQTFANDDGFADLSAEISAIEKRFGIGLAQFTPPFPPSL